MLTSSRHRGHVSSFFLSRLRPYAMTKTPALTRSRCASTPHCITMCAVALRQYHMTGTRAGDSLTGRPSFDSAPGLQRHVRRRTSSKNCLRGNCWLMLRRPASVAGRADCQTRSRPTFRGSAMKDEPSNSFSCSWRGVERDFTASKRRDERRKGRPPK